MADGLIDWERRLSTWIPILVGLCALMLTVYGGCEDRRFKRLSVRPELDLTPLFEKDWNGWVMRNNGLGPARVRWFRVSVDGQPKKDWVQVKTALPLPRGQFTFTNPYPDTIVRQGERVPLFGFPGNYPALGALQKAAGRVQMSICYCSLYEDCWRASSDSGYIVRESCRRAPDGAFEGSD